MLYIFLIHYKSEINFLLTNEFYKIVPCYFNVLKEKLKVVVLQQYSGEMNTDMFL